MSEKEKEILGIFLLMVSSIAPILFGWEFFGIFHHPPQSSSSWLTKLIGFFSFAQLISYPISIWLLWTCGSARSLRLFCIFIFFDGMFFVCFLAIGVLLLLGGGPVPG
jgi:hypothetical protein